MSSYTYTHREHLHYSVTSCLCTENIYIIVSQAAVTQGPPTLLCHKLSLHREHLHYCVISRLCTGNTYIIVQQAVFARRTPTLLCHKLPLHRDHLHYCHKLPFHREHLHYCVTSFLCPGNTYIIVSQAAFAQGPVQRQHVTQ
jgi:hypothetical protein